MGQEDKALLAHWLQPSRQPPPRPSMRQLIVQQRASATVEVLIMAAAAALALALDPHPRLIPSSFFSQSAQ